MTRRQRLLMTAAMVMTHRAAYPVLVGFFLLLLLAGIVLMGADIWSTAAHLIPRGSGCIWVLMDGTLCWLAHSVVLDLAWLRSRRDTLVRIRKGEGS